jgi:hypothetical protein
MAMPLFIARFKDCEVKVEYPKGVFVTFGTFSSPEFVGGSNMLSREVYFLKVEEATTTTTEEKK